MKGIPEELRTNVVLNALICRMLEDHREVTVAVRRAQTNRRHPGVVSLPTMRVPLIGLPFVERYRPLASRERPMFERVAGQVEEFGVPGAGRSMWAFLTETLLARKIGVSGLLEEGRLRGMCALRLIGAGAVDDPTGTRGIEATLMYTLAIEITQGAKLIPLSSPSYSYIRWVHDHALGTAWRQRDGQSLVPEANPLEVCIRGLCIRSGVELLAGPPDALDLGSAAAVQLRVTMDEALAGAP